MIVTDKNLWNAVAIEDSRRDMFYTGGRQETFTFLRLRTSFLPSLIADHLYGYQLVVLVVQTFQDLSKGAFPDHFEHLKPVAKVVVQHLG